MISESWESGLQKMPCVRRATQGIADVLANTVEKPAEYPGEDEDTQAQNDCFD